MKNISANIAAIFLFQASLVQAADIQKTNEANQSFERNTSFWDTIYNEVENKVETPSSIELSKPGNNVANTVSAPMLREIESTQIILTPTAMGANGVMSLNSQATGDLKSNETQAMAKAAKAPEPSTYLILASLLGMMAYLSYRKRAKKEV